MHTSQTRFRLWLSRWFGIGDTPETADRPVGNPDAARPADQQGPLFSLGDTKQDVVVSYRAAQTDES